MFDKDYLEALRSKLGILLWIVSIVSPLSIRLLINTRLLPFDKSLFNGQKHMCILVEYLIINAKSKI